MRVTGSCPINTPALACWSEPSCRNKYPNSLDEFRNMTRACIELCHAVRESRAEHQLPPAVLHLSMNPWQNPDVWPKGAVGNDPSLVGEVEKNYMRNMSLVLNEVVELCAKYRGQVQAALIDAERFVLNTPAKCNSSLMRSAITRKHDLLFNATLNAFPGIEIFRFQRGRVEKLMTLGEHSLYSDDMCADEGRCSEHCPVGYTGAERGTDCNIALYQVQELEAMRENFRRTVSHAKEHNATSVTPWIALGCGYRRAASHSRPLAFENNNDYPAVYSWELGGEVNNHSYSTPELSAEFAPWGWAKRVVLFPSPFETINTLPTGTANSSSTNIFDHFVAYVRGAAGLDGVHDGSAELLGLGMHVAMKLDDIADTDTEAIPGATARAAKHEHTWRMRDGAMRAMQANAHRAAAGAASLVLGEATTPSQLRRRCQQGSPSAQQSAGIVDASGFADPTGTTDAAPGLRKALAVLLAGSTSSSDRFALWSNVTDLSGRRLELSGGEYLLQSPLAIPGGVGNFEITGGTLRAGSRFPANGSLLSLGDDSGTHIESVSLTAMLLHGGGGLARGSLLNITYGVGISVGPAVYFEGFGGAGIQINHGAETLIHECWFVGQYGDGLPFFTPTEAPARPPNFTLFNSTAIQINGNDHYVSDVVIWQYTRLGVVVNGEGNLLSGVHAWGCGAVWCDRDWYLDLGLNSHSLTGIEINAPRNRVVACYLDENYLDLRSPVTDVVVSNSFFLGTSTRLIATGEETGRLWGLTLEGNSLDHIEFIGKWNASDARASIESDNIATSGLGFSAGRRRGSQLTTVRRSVSTGLSNRRQEFLFNFSDSASHSLDTLLMPEVSFLQYSVVFLSGEERTDHSIHMRDGTGTAVSVIFDHEVKAIVHVEARCCTGQRIEDGGGSLQSPLKSDDRDLVLNVVHRTSDTHGSSQPSAQELTLADAQRQLRLLRAAGHRGRLTIQLCGSGGLLADHGQIVLGAADSGLPGGPTVLRGGDGSTLDPGVRVTGCVQQQGSPLWQAKLPAGMSSRQLWVNGRRAARAHANPASCSGGPTPGPDPCRRLLSASATRTPTGYANVSSPLNVTVMGPPGIEHWVLPGAEFVYGKGSSGASWTEPRCAVVRVLPAASRGMVDIMMAQPCWARATGKSAPLPWGTGQSVTFPTDIENAFALLTEAGEWFANFSARTISYYPLPSDDMQSAVTVLGGVPGPQQVVFPSSPGHHSMAESILKVDAAAHIQIERLTFKHHTWLMPSTGVGYVDTQSGILATSDFCMSQFSAIINFK
eukprot:SAG11_NODE_277_length_11302_cov_5.987146_5_plen_1278_part_00